MLKPKQYHLSHLSQGDILGSKYRTQLCLDAGHVKFKQAAEFTHFIVALL